MNNSSRQAHFTSSQIHNLIKLDKYGNFQKPGKTYIQEKIYEGRFESCLSVGASSRAIYWGHLMEVICYETLGLEYRISSKETKLHPKYGDIWSGSVDLIVPKKRVGEIKCYGRKKFAQYADCLRKKDVALFKEEFAQEYWQIVSNSIIHELPKGEAILYMPFKSELIKIREIIEDTNFLEANNFEPWNYRYIVESDINDLNWLPDTGHYNNIERFEFVVPKEDKKLLTQRVIQAGKLLKKGVLE